MDTPIEQRLGQLLADSVKEFFRSRRLVLSPASGLQVPASYAALVAFSGERLHGAAGLGMHSSTLEQLLNPHDRTHPHGDQEWLREAANQVLGRLKRKLLEYGITVTIALPNVLSGARLHALRAPKAGRIEHVFNSRAGAIAAWLELTLRPGMELNLRELAEAPPCEGSVLIL